MSSKEKLEKIKENAKVVKQTIAELKNELKDVNKDYNNLLAKQLQEENAQLIAAVEVAKRHLMQLEIENGIQQISLPNEQKQNFSTLTSSHKINHEAASTETSIVEGSHKCSNTEKLAKEPKPKKKEPKEQKEPGLELPVDVGRLDLRIAKIEEVTYHPDANTLYVLKINCGEDNLRTVCSGLVKHISIDDLKDKQVVLLCNLKPAKMRGITSEAMIMCASSEQGVEVLQPPEGCKPGEHVHCESYDRKPDSVMNPKKKIFETVAPDLHTNDSLQACYKKMPLYVPEKGNITAKTLKNVPVK